MCIQIIIGIVTSRNVFGCCYFYQHYFFLLLTTFKSIKLNQTNTTIQPHNPQPTTHNPFPINHVNRRYNRQDFGFQ